MGSRLNKRAALFAALRHRALVEPRAGGHVARGDVPGLVALVARGDDIATCVLGALAEGGPPVQRDSLFRISSMTKPITAVAALIVIDDGASGARGAFGWDGGLGSNWRADPATGQTTILLTQQAWASPAPPAVCRDFWAAARG